MEDPGRARCPGQRSRLRLDNHRTGLIEDGRYDRPRLGVLLGHLNPDAAYRLLGREAAVFIDTILPASPAAEAGLRDGDVIVEIDGDEITSILEVQQAVICRDFGDPVRMVVLRGNRELEFTVRAGREGD